MGLGQKNFHIYIYFFIFSFLKKFHTFWQHFETLKKSSSFFIFLSFIEFTN